ncbi:MAG: DUF6492 family protein [Lachnospiraceae bacterium]|nr:DUF6492 family protein [Lachnospiraceae bacterium]
MQDRYDTLVVVTPKDFKRLEAHYTRLADNLPGRLIFVGNDETCSLAAALNNERIISVNEDDILPFDSVHRLMTERMQPLLQGTELPRGITGWYYQQFLKMQYSALCTDSYYMTWDGDTVPCHPISMFQAGSGKPYFDVKKEYHKEYFDTLAVILPGMSKVISHSFISEHMLFNTAIMKELIAAVEANDKLPGNAFWEKILYAIPVEKIQETAFSEFETYGTFTALRHMSAYAIREWHSFRLAGEFFDPDTICERDFAWLAKDFDAVSFEKGHSVREDHKNLFDNPDYQQKLSARQMLEAIQDLLGSDRTEEWDTI